MASSRSPSSSSSSSSSSFRFSLLVALLFTLTFLPHTLATSEVDDGTTTTSAVTGTPSPVADPASKPDRALLAFDKVVSGPLVAGMNVTVTYVVYNVGLHPASDISLRDSSYPSSRFETDASPRISWPTLAPGESHMHSIGIQPRRSGQLYVTPPTVTYNDPRDGVKRAVRLAEGFEDDAVVVEDLIEYRRKHDRHTSTWILYIVAFLLLSIVPFGVSGSMKSNLNGKSAAASAQKKSS